MEHKAISMRPFIGSKDYELSRSFYRDLGFKESILFDKMCRFQVGDLSFYLQDAYVKDWIDNSMIFLEVADAELYYQELLSLDLPSRYPGVRLTPVQYEPWGRECFLHDPSGILWHFGEFNNP